MIVLHVLFYCAVLVAVVFAIWFEDKIVDAEDRLAKCLRVKVRKVLRKSKRIREWAAR